MLTLTILDRLRHLREDRDLFQEHVADHLGVTNQAVSLWERHTRSPSIQHAAAYARLVNHRLVARRGNTIVDVLTILPNLGRFRKLHGVTQAALDQRTRATRACFVEARCQSTGIRLITLQGYLAGLGYELVLIPADVAEVA
ncbi:helix-turn-helix transcriptional regulator [Streptosporangium vulgare]|uniref:Helix-turn-helix transcriptional regulator n=1 Tax=Streptosporangium vulgare TaxID=46190 RepID=A0ABV5TQ96_9ACTN